MSKFERKDGKTIYPFPIITNEIPINKETISSYNKKPKKLEEIMNNNTYLLVKESDITDRIEELEKDWYEWKDGGAVKKQIAKELQSILSKSEKVTLSEIDWKYPKNEGYTKLRFIKPIK